MRYQKLSGESYRGRRGSCPHGAVEGRPGCLSHLRGATEAPSAFTHPITVLAAWAEGDCELESPMAALEFAEDLEARPLRLRQIVI
jgi:hypothetical protein